MAQGQEGLNWVLGGARARAFDAQPGGLTLTLRAGGFSMGHPKHEYLWERPAHPPGRGGWDPFLVFHQSCCICSV